MTLAGAFLFFLSLLLSAAAGSSLEKRNDSLAGLLVLQTFAAAIIGFILIVFGGR